MRTNNPWRWSTLGKHPAARDYFHLGEQNPFASALSEWMDSGYRRISEQREKGAYPIQSWRFCLKGHKKGHIVCGIVRDSCDGVGRPYPILVLGTGSLEKWEGYWDLLPYALERTWCEMEHLSTSRYTGLKELEEDLHILPPPQAEWADFQAQREEERGGTWSDRISPWTGSASPWSETGCHPSGSSPVRTHGFAHPAAGPRGSGQTPLPQPSSGLLVSNQVYLMMVDSSHFRNSYTLAGKRLFRLRERGKAEPSALFLGGTTGVTCILAFQRSIVPRDFEMLWNISSVGVAEYGFDLDI